MSIIIRHGDCLSILKSMPSASIDLIVTDPPYELTTITDVLAESRRLLKPNGQIYVFGDKRQVASKWYAEFEYCFSHWSTDLLFWHYKNSPKPKGRWRMSVQAIMYAYAKDSMFDEDKARTDYMPATLKLHGRVRPSSGRLSDAKPYDTSKGALPKDVIEWPALLGHLAKERFGHRDQKPLGLIQRLIETSSKEGDTVLDPYAGTGTTGAAAFRSKRSCVLIEKNSEWIRVIQERVKE